MTLPLQTCALHPSFALVSSAPQPLNLLSQRRAQSSADTVCEPVPVPPDEPLEEPGPPESLDDELHAVTDAAKPRTTRAKAAQEERSKRGMPLRLGLVFGSVTREDTW